MMALQDGDAAPVVPLDLVERAPALVRLRVAERTGVVAAGLAPTPRTATAAPSVDQILDRIRAVDPRVRVDRDRGGRVSVAIDMRAPLTPAQQAAARRAFQDAQRELVGAGYDAAAVAHALGELVVRDARADVPMPALASAAEIARPLRAPKWILPSLGWMHGRPGLISAFNNTGKSPLGQALALAVASGADSVWGGVAVRLSGSVVHLDYEVGEWLTRSRYQRLAFAAGIDLAALGDRLRVAHFPPKLTERRAKDVLRRLCDGAALCWVDPFSVAAQGARDDESRRVPLDLANEIGAETGCTFVFCVHEIKQHESTRDRPATQRVRGHGSITDAAGSVLSVERRGDTFIITNTKPTFSGNVEPVRVRFADVGREDSLTGIHEGLAVELLADDDVTLDEHLSNERLADAKQRVRETLRKVGPAPKSRILDKTSGRGDDNRAALNELIDDGEVATSPGDRKAIICTLAPNGEPEP